ncbi:MAG: hypothetical protein JST93_13210 [Acidobacteria bacterium]|nr:hypothetical protein [Acidobacteriota bacterium]
MAAQLLGKESLHHMTFRGAISPALTRLQPVVCLSLVFVHSLAASALLVEVGVAGGSGSAGAPVGCIIYGPPAEIGSWGFGPGIVPTNGISACGYTGAVQNVSGAAGPLLAEQITTAAYSDGGVFNGTARARADYGDLGVYVSASSNGGIGGTDVTGASALARQIESMIIQNSALNGQAGVVTFTFTVSGSMLNVGSGLTHARLAYRQTPQSLPGDGMFIASVNQNSTPLLSFTPVVNNWVLSPGSLTGSASIQTAGLSMVFGSPFDLDVALMLYAIPRFGSGLGDMYGSAHLSGIAVRTSGGQLVTDFTVNSGSGTLYTADGVQSTVPEPGTFLFAAGSLAAVLVGRRTRRA